MKTSKIKFNLLIIMLALSAGIIFFACGYLTVLPKNVTVNGIAVGGKSYVAAAREVRSQIENQLKNKSLTVYGNNGSYVFTYPEIGYKDNLQSILKNAKKGGQYTATVKYYLNGISEISEIICADESAPAVEPYAIFNSEGEPFTYFDGNDGVRADRLKLVNDMRASLSGNFQDVYVSVKEVKRTVSQQTVKYNTRLLSTFTTRFDGGNRDRAYNIYLAASRINGTVLRNGEGFSFNECVGQRSAERGFKPAKIIENGEFVEGIGGGVCQVSTTLFNAAILAGCEITEFHPHSLAVSYVPPSFDAMVSGTYFDLKFENKTGYTLYIRAQTKENSITFNIYGRGDGATYGFSSVITGDIAAPEEKTDDLNLARDGRNGTVSEGYLTVYRNGVSVTTLFRRDKYAPLKRIIYEAPPDASCQDSPEQ